MINDKIISYHRLLE